ncbi:MAG: hypothetical protein R6U98_33525 [Pirellulaceae bacterium]
MESYPTQAVLPLVGLAAEKVIHDRYIFQAVGFFRVERCPAQAVLPLVGLAAEKVIRDRYNDGSCRSCTGGRGAPSSFHQACAKMSPEDRRPCALSASCIRPRPRWAPVSKCRRRLLASKVLNKPRPRTW